MAVSKAPKTGRATLQKQQVRDIVTRLINAHFQNTLGKEPDVVNIVMALIQYESSFSPTPATIHVNVKGTSKTYQRYLKMPAIAPVYNNGTPTQKQAIIDGGSPMGLMQSMGWNFIRGSGSGDGVRKCLYETVRPDIALPLCVNPGEDIRSKITGPENLEKAILAGLIVLESKLKVLPARSGPVTINKFTFPNRFTAAVGGYLGYARDTATGLTPDRYVMQIFGGAKYREANSNSPASQTVTYQVASSSSSTTSSSTGPTNPNPGLKPIIPAGC